jgi:hypothetical protein
MTTLQDTNEKSEVKTVMTGITVVKTSKQRKQKRKDDNRRKNAKSGATSKKKADHQQLQSNGLLPVGVPIRHGHPILGITTAIPIDVHRRMSTRLLPIASATPVTRSVSIDIPNTPIIATPTTSTASTITSSIKPAKVKKEVREEEEEEEEEEEGQEEGSSEGISEESYGPTPKELETKENNSNPESPEYNGQWAQHTEDEFYQLYMALDLKFREHCPRMSREIKPDIADQQFQTSTWPFVTWSIHSKRLKGKMTFLGAVICTISNLDIAWSGSNHPIRRMLIETRGGHPDGKEQANQYHEQMDTTLDMLKILPREQPAVKAPGEDLKNLKATNLKCITDITVDDKDIVSRRNYTLLHALKQACRVGELMDCYTGFVFQMNNKERNVYSVLGILRAETKHAITFLKEVKQKAKTIPIKDAKEFLNLVRYH